VKIRKKTRRYLRLGFFFLGAILTPFVLDNTYNNGYKSGVSDAMPVAYAFGVFDPNASQFIESIPKMLEMINEGNNRERLD